MKACQKQRQFDNNYCYKHLIGMVLNGDMAGVQMWIVPQTDPFRSDIVSDREEGGTG